MSGFQIGVVILSFAIAALDGFDVLVSAYTAPSISQEWLLTPTQIGTLLSAGLIGMGAGALTIGPMGDRVGRRPTILLCLLILFAGMAGASTSINLYQLGAWRAFTGIGIGGILVNINVLVGEFSSTRYRHLAVVLMSIGYPIGATVGGIISVYLIRIYGWQSVYLFGALAAFGLLPLSLILIPESIEFLMSRQPRNALAIINRVLRRLGRPPIESLPPKLMDDRIHARFAGIFRHPYHIGAIAAGIYYLSVMMTGYFLLSWLPKIITLLGFDIRTGIFASLLLNLGGVIGCLVYGFFAKFLGVRRMALGQLVGLSIAIATFGYVRPISSVLLIVAAAIGFCLHSSVAALYVLVPFTFPVKMRGTGTGFAMGMGRVGAMIGPYVAGLLMAAGVSRLALFAYSACPLVVAAISIYWIRDYREMTIDRNMNPPDKRWPDVNVGNSLAGEAQCTH